MNKGFRTRVAPWRTYAGVGLGIAWLGTVAITLSLHACGGGGGGELRAVVVTNKTNCNDLTAAGCVVGQPARRQQRRRGHG